jgi:hypothetical protein
MSAVLLTLEKQSQQPRQQLLTNENQPQDEHLVTLQVWDSDTLNDDLLGQAVVDLRRQEVRTLVAIATTNRKGKPAGKVIASFSPLQGRYQVDGSVVWQEGEEEDARGVGESRDMPTRAPSAHVSSMSSRHEALQAASAPGLQALTKGSQYSIHIPNVASAHLPAGGNRALSPAEALGYVDVAIVAVKNVPSHVRLILEAMTRRQQPTKLESGTLAVTVKGLRHLPKMDTFGKCDPMVQLNLCGKKTSKTKTIKNVYDADFSSEGPFVLTVNESSHFSGGVVAHVYDWNLTGQKLIGQASISQQELKELATTWQGDSEVKKVYTKTLTRTNSKGAPLGEAVKGHNKEPTAIDLEITWVGGTQFPCLASTKIQTLTPEELQSLLWLLLAARMVGRRHFRWRPLSSAQ